MEACGSDSRYVRAVDKHDRLIGQGCSTDGVQRWYDTQSQMSVAAKSMINKSYQARREALAMQRAADYDVPRVVKLVEQVDISPQQTYVVMEHIEGITISSYVAQQTNATPAATAENRMLTVAVQVFDTLHALHSYAEMAHLDLNSENIMLSRNADSPWNGVRLIDFGASLLFPACKKDVITRTISPRHAAPEVLQSGAKQTRRFPDKELLVNGPAADVWSSAVVLYQMLTGKLPFECKRPANLGDDVAKLKWFDSIADERSEWAKAVEEAEEQGTVPQHPLIQRIRQHSATPELAVDFFAKLFHPRTARRPTAAEALEHPYLKSCNQQMQDYFFSCKNPDGMLQPQDSAADLCCFGKTPTAKQVSLAQSEGADAIVLHPCKPHPLRRLSSAAGRRLHVPQGLRLVKRSVGIVLRPLARLHHHIHPKHCDAPTAASSHYEAPPSRSSRRSAGAAMAGTIGVTGRAVTSSPGPTSPPVPLSAYFPRYKHEPSLASQRAQAPTVLSLTATSGSQADATALPANATQPAETSLEQGVQLPAAVEAEVPSLPQLCSERLPASQPISSAGRSCHPPGSPRDASTEVDRQAVGAANTRHGSSRRKRGGWFGKVGKGLAAVGAVVVGVGLFLAASRR